MPSLVRPARAIVWLAMIALVAIVAGWAHGANTPPLMAPGDVGALVPGADAGHVGSATCAGCHAPEAKAWLSSQHAHAMTVAVPDTVRGDFGDVRASADGSSARFFRKDGRYMVETEGADGKTATFTISHTFGWEPLQQYLVKFPDGRVQALGWAWDTRPKDKGGQRWFHLHPGETIPPGDPMHWTGSLANWNYMCAECHSTAVRKNYDATANRFATSFSEVSVGCEGCHGAGAGHVAWAKAGADPKTPRLGFASIAARRPLPDWTANPATGSPAHGVSRPIGDEVETCAHCHARRGELIEAWKPGHPLTDTHLPSLLSTELFEDDGQMKDEVFNDHSFKQSLMYGRGVTCTDCHDPHTAKLKAPGAQVCSGCHLPAKFDTVAHSGHPPGANAPDCLSCHMPVRTYMVVDPRHDHSFRIPRPDLSVALGTPNACTDCHTGNSPAWAAAAIARWHGPVRKGFQTWGGAVNLARTGAPAARAQLLALAADPQVPPVAQATILSELQRYHGATTDTVTIKALSNRDPMVRVVALRSLEGQPLEVRWQRASPMLSDPVLAVRIEAANQLAEQPVEVLSPADRGRLEAAFAAYVASQRLDADRAEGRANLGTFLLRRGDVVGAEAEYRAGLKLAPQSEPLVVDLADLYRAQSREADADALLRQAIAATPGAAALRFAHGLSLIRQKQYEEALAAFAKATALDPGQPHYAYVEAVGLQSTGKPDDARRVIAQALALHPNDGELLMFALQDALRSNDADRAAPIAVKLSLLLPDNAELAQLVTTLKTKP